MVSEGYKSRAWFWRLLELFAVPQSRQVFPTRVSGCVSDTHLDCSRLALRLFSTRTTPIPNARVPNTPQLQPTRLTFVNRLLRYKASLLA